MMSNGSSILAQNSEPVPSEFLRDSVDLEGKGILSSWRDTVTYAVLTIERPYPVWLAISIGRVGSKTHETIGYDSLLHSLEVQRDLNGLPERFEIQLIDSTYMSIEFHLGDDRIRAIGRFRKYYGQFTGLTCIDQEDSTYVAKERSCPLVYSEVLRSWQEPCEARTGEWLHYWPNGVLESRGEYHPKEFEGVQDGFSHFEGETYFVQITKDTWVKIGTWEYFNEEGHLIGTVNHDPVWNVSPSRR